MSNSNEATEQDLRAMIDTLTKTTEQAIAVLGELATVLQATEVPVLGGPFFVAPVDPFADDERLQINTDLKCAEIQTAFETVKQVQALGVSAVVVPSTISSVPLGAFLNAVHDGVMDRIKDFVEAN